MGLENLKSVFSNIGENDYVFELTFDVIKPDGLLNS